MPENSKTPLNKLSKSFFWTCAFGVAFRQMPHQTLSVRQMLSQSDTIAATGAVPADRCFSDRCRRLLSCLLFSLVVAPERSVVQSRSGDGIGPLSRIGTWRIRVLGGGKHLVDELLRRLIASEGVIRQSAPT